MKQIDVESARSRITRPRCCGARRAPGEKIDDNLRRLVEKMADILVEKKGWAWRPRRRECRWRLFIVSLSGKRGDVRA